MTASKGGAPRKRGTAKEHTTQRLEHADKAWLRAQAKLHRISAPDVIHGLVEAAKLPGSEAEKNAHLTSELVFFQNELARIAKSAGRDKAAARDAHEKNFLLSQRLRACIAAFASLPADIQRRLPDRLLATSRRVLSENEVPEDQRVVVY